MLIDIIPSGRKRETAKRRYKCVVKGSKVVMSVTEEVWKTARAGEG